MNIKFFIWLLILIPSFFFAQSKTASIGLTTSFEVFKFDQLYPGNQRFRGKFYGLEYAETYGKFGFRTGIQYAKLKDQLDYNQILPMMGIYIRPVFENAHQELIDIPISGQFYLGSKKIRMFTNLGLLTTVTINDMSGAEFFIDDTEENKSISLRGIAGGGFNYRFLDFLAIDISYQCKFRFKEKNNQYLYPYNSEGIQMKLSYILKN